MKKVLLLNLVVLSLLFPGILKAQTEDAAGCKDHPLFARIPGYVISECSVKDSGSFSFPVESRVADDVKKKSVQGRYSYYSYVVKEGTAPTFPLLIYRDMESELKQARGLLFARVVDPDLPVTFLTGEVPLDNMDTWVLLNVNKTGYQMNIIEKAREVKVIPAMEMWEILSKKDTVTLDIFFDDDTTTIIQASYPVIDEVVNMMKEHPTLMIDIQDHTDNNAYRRDLRILAAERAKIVLDAITAGGIEKSRMTSKGWGPLHPVADNSTYEGRALNRRVVIVKVKE